MLEAAVDHGLKADPVPFRECLEYRSYFEDPPDKAFAAGVLLLTCGTDKDDIAGFVESRSDKLSPVLKKVYHSKHGDTALSPSALEDAVLAVEPITELETEAYRRLHAAE